MVAWHMLRHKEHPTEDEAKWPTGPLSRLLRSEIHIPESALASAAVEMLNVPHLKLVQQKPDKKFNVLLQQILRDAEF